jgi:hypothetical protein
MVLRFKPFSLCSHSDSCPVLPHRPCPSVSVASLYLVYVIIVFVLSYGTRTLVLIEEVYTRNVLL